MYYLNVKIVLQALAQNIFKWITESDENLNISCLWQLKKTTEELNEALATKEEIAQRCHELDMQVSLLQSLCQF